MISERLGHASVAFTVQTYSHVIPGMDKDTAATVADLILSSTQKGPGTVVPNPSANKPATTARSATLYESFERRSIGCPPVPNQLSTRAVATYPPASVPPCS